MKEKLLKYFWRLRFEIKAYIHNFKMRKVKKAIKKWPKFYKELDKEV